MGIKYSYARHTPKVKQFRIKRIGYGSMVGDVSLCDIISCHNCPTCGECFM